MISVHDHGVASTVQPVLLSSERWDDVWRRNQQLAARVDGTVFVEPARRGFRARWRVADGVAVVTPAKALPLRWKMGRALHARLTARAIRAGLPGRPLVVWATHALGAPLARALAAPIVYDRTDDWPAMEQSPTARGLVEHYDRELIREADALVVVSEPMRDELRQDAVHIPNGVDSAAFSRRPRPGANGRLRIGFAGTLDPLRFDMDILGELARADDVTLVLAGPGHTVPGSEHHGVVRHAELPELLATCDALVAPYRTDCEANRTSDSIKLYEYFATGLPVIATPTAGFERFPDLVAYWPVQPPLRDAIAGLGAMAARRREIARHADWEQRASAMQGVLAQAARRW
ncbi:MAG: glycosyltransferase family 1 protein [Chloroflexi bacterium]|nr:MAG: glycosyltransferase family 1 protein [Chloroflexota bacterium]